MPNLSALILAAGKGVRMKSKLPKVLHPIGGVPMVEHVVKNLARLKIKKICVVVGFQGDHLQKYLKSKYPQLQFAKQKKLDGSGGAVRQARAWLGKVQGSVLVTCGDAPLIEKNTFAELARAHQNEKNQATVLTSQIPTAAGYGRIVRSPGGSVLRIVEELDATPREKSINEINTGTYCFDAKALTQAIGKIKNNNAKKEYYLTDVLDILNQSGGRVGGQLITDFREALGVNSQKDLALAEGFFYLRKNEQLMNSGVRIMDPASTFIDEEISISPETVIFPQTFILGQGKIGSGCHIGPWVYMKDVTVENDAKILSSFLESAIIGREAKIGPYSRVRPGTVVGPQVHVGNFSELKKTTLGVGSKVNHLSYLGDAKVGKNVNIGAGTITCNYDGYRKYPTQIDDYAFIGSNANLIAPIKIGAHAVVGAGSSLSQNVPAWSLAVERAPSKIKSGWAKQRAKKGWKKK